MLEREIKQLLTKELYDKLLAETSASQTRKQHTQINYYYDTPDFRLYEQGMTLRVRQKDSSLSLELKYPVEHQETYKVKRELAHPIGELPMTFPLEKFFTEIPLQGEAQLVQMLVTERTRIAVSDSVRIDLDKSSYLGIVDYEIEIEFEEGSYDQAYHTYTSILPHLTLTSSGGKNARFFQRYFQIMNISR